MFKGSTPHITHGEKDQELFDESPSISTVAFDDASPDEEFGFYEFNESENKIVARCASRTRLWGFFSVLIGLAHCLILVPHQLQTGNLGMVLSQGIVGATGVIVGVVFLRSAKAMAKIVTTRGDDIQHLMAAFHQLGRAFILQAIAAFVGLMFIMIIYFAAASVASMLTSGR